MFLIPIVTVARLPPAISFSTEIILGSSQTPWQEPIMLLVVLVLALIVLAVVATA
jgi:hypothetical protein